MKTLANTLLCTSFALASTFALAQTAMSPPMNKDGTTMTMQNCKDHMAMSEKAGSSKDEDMKNMDVACMNMMKNNKGAGG